MNSRLYRVIFNKNLGRLVVVSEKTVAQGKAGSQVVMTTATAQLTVKHGVWLATAMVNG